MQQLVYSFAERPLASIAIGAFLSGVALFYLVMQRTRRRRIEKALRDRI